MIKTNSFDLKMINFTVILLILLIKTLCRFAVNKIALLKSQLLDMLVNINKYSEKTLKISTKRVCVISNS